jgi:hypothetical protein
MTNKKISHKNAKNIKNHSKNKYWKIVKKKIKYWIISQT